MVVISSSVLVTPACSRRLSSFELKDAFASSSEEEPGVGTAAEGRLTGFFDFVGPDLEGGLKALPVELRTGGMVPTQDVRRDLVDLQNYNFAFGRALPRMRKFLFRVVFRCRYYVDHLVFVTVVVHSSIKSARRSNMVLKDTVSAILGGNF